MSASNRSVAHARGAMAWLTAVLCLAQPVRGQGVTTECAAAAATCVASCAVSGALGSIFGGGRRGAGSDACRAGCERERQQCERGSAGAPGDATGGVPAPAPLPAGNAGLPTKKSPAVASGGAAAGHPFPVQQLTRSDEIEPVLPVVHDSSVMVGYSYLHSGKPPPTVVAYTESDIEATRMFMLMHIAAHPDVLDHPQRALAVARAFLPPQAWDEYIDCGVTSRDCSYVLQLRQTEDRRMMRRGVAARLHVGQNWKGSNEFDRPRSHRAFVERYGPILRAQAPALPQDITVVVQVSMGTYSATESLLPFGDRGGDPTKYSPFGAPLTLPLAMGYCAATSVAWPVGIPAGPAEAEALVGSLGSSRRAYLAIRTRVTDVDASSIGVRGSAGWDTGGCRSKAQVQGIELYADDALTRRLHTFGAPRAAPAPAGRVSQAPVAPAPAGNDTPATPAAPAAAAKAAALLNDDTLRLYVIRHKPNWRELLNLQQALVLRSRLEASYYSRRYDDVWPAFDPWGPFLSSQVAGRNRFDDPAVAEFAAWSQQRAAQLPDTLVARFLADGRGSVVSQHIDMGYEATSANIEVPGLFEGEMMRRISQRLAAAKVAPATHIVPLAIYFGDARTGVRDAALVLPAPVASYSMTATDAQRRRIGADPRVEMQMTVQEVSFSPSADGSEVLVLRVRPTHLRLLGERFRTAVAEFRL